MNRFFFLTSLLGGVLVFASTFLDAVAESPAASDGGLQMEWKDQYLKVMGDQIPGGPIQIHYLEAYCRPGSTDRDWSQTVIPHQSRLLEASSDRKRIELEDRLEDGVVVQHRLIADRDSVTFEVVAKNPTEKKSLAHWAQPCMRVDRFVGTNKDESREVQPSYIRKCFLQIDGHVRRLPTEPWALQARYVPGQVYAAPDVDRNDVNPRPLSELRPSSSLCGCFSADESMILAIAWEPYQEIFQGVITCLHNDFRIGGLAPGETKTIRGRLYVVPADMDALWKRFEHDFPRKD